MKITFTLFCNNLFIKQRLLGELCMIIIIMIRIFLMSVFSALFDDFALPAKYLFAHVYE